MSETTQATTFDPTPGVLHHRWVNVDPKKRVAEPHCPHHEAAQQHRVAGVDAHQRTRDRRFSEEAEAARKAKAEAKEKEKVAKADKDKRCSAARELAQFLEERTAHRLVTKADDGNYGRMDEDEFMKRLDAAKKDVATNCG